MRNIIRAGTCVCIVLNICGQCFAENDTSVTGPVDLLRSAIACELKPQAENEDDRAVYVLTRRAAYTGDRLNFGINITKKESNFGTQRGSNVATFNVAAKFADISSVAMNLDRHPPRVDVNVQVPSLIYGIRMQCKDGAKCFHETHSFSWSLNQKDRRDCSSTVFCRDGMTSVDLKEKFIDFCSKSAATDAIDSINALIAPSK